MRLKTLLLLSAITTPLMIAVMLLHGAPMKKVAISPNGIVDMELARTVPRATEVYEEWNGKQVIPVAINNTLIDFIFIVSYGCFLYSCCLQLARQYQNRWRIIGVWISRLMIFAALFDVIENILMFRTLGGHIHKEIVASTFMFASAKFILLILGLVYILLSLVGWATMGKRKDEVGQAFE